MYDDENGGGAGALLTLLFGIAIGVAGTLVYAAINEEQFGSAVRRTKKVTGTAQEAIGDFRDQAVSKAKGIADRVQSGVESATDTIKGAAGQVADSVEDNAAEIAKKARNAKQQLDS